MICDTKTYAKWKQDLIQGCHGRLLTAMTPIVAATSPARHHCHRCILSSLNPGNTAVFPFLPIMLALQFTFSHISLETFQSLCELYRYWSSEAVKSLSRILLACSFSATGVQTTTYTDDMHPFSYLKMSHSMHLIGTVQNYRYLLRLEFCVLQLNWRTYTDRNNFE